MSEFGDVTKAEKVLVETETKQVFPERTKVLRKKAEDDIEEFDTSEEEEEEKVKDESDYTKHLIYEGDKCLYKEPGTSRVLEWDKSKNEWCKFENSCSICTALK